jgi:hypothetical protein
VYLRTCVGSSGGGQPMETTWVTLCASHIDGRSCSAQKIKRAGWTDDMMCGDA